MAWPDFPPPEQFDVYGVAGELLSGTLMYVTRPDSTYGQEPVEFTNGDDMGPAMLTGWFHLAALETWIADNPGYDPDNPGGGGTEPDPEPVVSELALAVAKFLDGADDADLVALAEEHVGIMSALVRAYTRGRGFDTEGAPLDDVRAVIITATARLMANPEQADTYAGGAGVRGGFVGFSLPEQIALNTFRRRSA